MSIQRRRLLLLAAGAVAARAVSRAAWAQGYPTRPVRIIVGYPAGGGADFNARLMGQWLSERLGQSFIVENRPGAASNIATEAVVRAAPDGYTLLLVNINNAVNATSYDKLSFNFVHDITPIALLAACRSSWQCIRRFQRRPFLNSSPIPRQTRARSISHPKALEAPDSC